MAAADRIYIFRFSTFALGALPLRKWWSNQSGDDTRRGVPKSEPAFLQHPALLQTCFDGLRHSQESAARPTHAVPRNKVAQKLTSSNLDFRSSMGRGHASCNARGWDEGSLPIVLRSNHGSVNLRNPRLRTSETTSHRIPLEKRNLCSLLRAGHP